MTRLEWGQGLPMYDLGLDRGVLYLDETAVPWNGLVALDERDTGEVNVEHYFEGNRRHSTQVTGDFEATISAYTYPDIFSEYNGYSERETYRRFGLSYRTQHNEGYKLHLLYNVLIRDDSRSWKTVSSSIDPSLFNWGIRCSAVPIPGASPASHLIMEIGENSEAFETLEDILYGTDSTPPRLPDPEEIVELYETATYLRITYNGDGTYTAEGSDLVVELLGDGSFEIDSPAAFLIEEGVFQASSY